MHKQSIMPAYTNRIEVPLVDRRFVCVVMRHGDGSRVTVTVAADGDVPLYATRTTNALRRQKHRVLILTHPMGTQWQRFLCVPAVRLLVLKRTRSLCVSLCLSVYVVLCVDMLFGCHQTNNRQQLCRSL